MRDNSIVETIIGSLVTLALAGLLVWVGWKEPLRYRFMTESEIAEAEAANFPITQVDASQWSPKGTALDRSPYRKTKDGMLRYSRNHDLRETGVPTETGFRPYTRGIENPYLPGQ